MNSAPTLMLTTTLSMYLSRNRSVRHQVGQVALYVAFNNGCAACQHTHIIYII